MLDAAHYDGLACALLDGDGYALRVPAGRTATSCGRPFAGDNPPTAFRPPGWPVVLAGVYGVSAPVTEHRWTAARVAQALIGTLAVALIGLLAWRLLGPAGGLAALALAAVDTTLLGVGASLMSEPLFVCLVAGSLLAALAAREGGRRWLVAAGVLIGLATLVRTNGLVLVPVLALLASRRPRDWAVVAGCAVLAIAPWTVRNVVVMDAFVPVASYFGTGLAGTFNESTRTRTDHPGGWQSPRNVPELRDVHLSGMSELDKQAELRRRALRHLREHPGYAVEVAGRNAARMLSLGDVGWQRSNAGALGLPPWAGLTMAAGFWVLLALAAIAVVAGPGRRLPWAWWLGPPLLVLSAALLGGELRYRAPVEPFLIVAAAALVARPFRPNVPRCGL